MIKLILDDLEISVKEDNPLHKTLKRFDGETFVVCVGEEVVEEKPPEKVRLPTFAVEADTYYNLLNDSFSKEFLDTPTGAILRSHLDNVFTSGGIRSLHRVGSDYKGNIIFATEDNSFALVSL